jgi:hypothetical protein
MFDAFGKKPKASGLFRVKMQLQLQLADAFIQSDLHRLIHHVQTYTFF